MAFNVKYSEVQDLQNEYQQYETDLRDAEYALNDRILELVGLETFQGTGANAIKGYFSEVHQTLLRGLDSLAHQLATEYGDHYYTRFGEKPILETNANAQWPSSAMNDARKALVSLRDGDLDSAELSLQRAVAAMPAEFQFSVPSATDAKAAVTDEVEHQKKVRDAVKAAEEEGTRTFEGASGDFSAMRESLAALIAACGKGAYTVANYVPGSFQSLMEETGFIDAYNSCAQYQDENAEMLVAAREDSVAKKQVRIEQAAREEAEKKARWAIVGTVASVLVMVGAAAAVVASAGAATPLLIAAKAGVASIGLATATWDTAKRIDQLDQILDGDPYATRSENEALDESADAAKSYGKYQTTQFEADYWNDNGHYYHSSSLSHQADTIGQSFLIDAVTDQGIDQIQDEKTKTAVKVIDTVADEVRDQYFDWKYEMDFKVDGFGIASTIGKCGTIVADYNMDQADAQLNELRDESNSLNEMQQRATAQQSYDWGMTW